MSGRRFRGARAVVLMSCVAVWALACRPSTAPPSTAPSPAAPAASAPSPAPARATPAPRPTPDAASRPAFDEAARAAWTFVKAHVEPATGWIAPLENYHYATIWDVASGMAALFCARELGYLDDATYHSLMRRALGTLKEAQLFDGIAYNKSYSTRTGRMVGRNNSPTARGTGWSVTDIGRLLLWLKIIAQHQPEYAADAETIARRNSSERLVRGGYVWGASVFGSRELREYQEGRIGYEQYAAEGFRAWGFPVARAVDVSENAVPIRIMGKQLAADLRAYDRLTSEPFVLLGLEAGWSPEVHELAAQLLAAQEERYRRTGKVTIVSEDAISRAPHYFYYYCAYTKAREFAIDVQDPGAVVSGPRWVSAKATYGWHALLPSSYTRKAVASVAPARTPRGWGSGVYEADGRSTGTVNINTQAVILEAALYHRRGGPLLSTPKAP